MKKHARKPFPKGLGFMDDKLHFAGVDDRGQRRVLPRTRDAGTLDRAGAGFDRLLQRLGQVVPRDALFHPAPHIVSMGNPGMMPYALRAQFGD
jgi:hypothetical protein